MATRNKTPQKKASRRPLRPKSGKRDPSASQPPDPKTAKEPARWTVMVYLAGDNNLTEECAFAITEMEQAGQTGTLDELNILVQFDPRGSRLPTQRFSIEKDLTAKVFRAVPTKARPHSSLGETDTGLPRTLTDFVSWAIEEYPAYSYMVVLSGHAAGVENTFLMKDESPSGSLGTLDLKEAFRNLKDQTSIDIVGMDSCLMSMAEIAYQLRDSVKVLIGSEGYSPLAGWPWRPILKEVIDSIKTSTVDLSKPASAQEPKLDAERKKLAVAIVKAYAKYYFDFVRGGIDVDQAAIDTSKYRELSDPVRRLGDKMGVLLKQKNKKFRDALVMAHWDAQSYNGEIYVDLKDFCQCLIERMKDKVEDAQIKAACEDIINLIDPKKSDSYVLESCYTGPTFQYSHGVSIYFPWYEVFPYYSNLDFSSATDWYKFLETYVQETRREPRPNRFRDEAGEPFLGDNKSTLPVRQVSGRQVSGRDDRPVIRSMRNAPISLIGLTSAFEEDKEIIDKLRRL